MRALGEPFGAAHRLGRLGDGDDDLGIADTGFRRRHRPRLDPELLFQRTGIGLAVLGRACEHVDALDRPHRAHRHDLRARLPAGADHPKRVRIRIGQQLGGEAARRTGARLSEQVSLDHGFEPAVG
jgi:hypothetical protein